MQVIENGERCDAMHTNVYSILLYVYKRFASMTFKEQRNVLLSCIAIAFLFQLFLTSKYNQQGHQRTGQQVLRILSCINVILTLIN